MLTKLMTKYSVFVSFQQNPNIHAGKFAHSQEQIIYKQFAVRDETKFGLRARFL